MRIELQVEEVKDVKIRSAKSGTSAYIYLPIEYAGKSAKLCIIKEKKKK